MRTAAASACALRVNLPPSSPSYSIPSSSSGVDNSTSKDHVYSRKWSAGQKSYRGSASTSFLLRSTSRAYKVREVYFLLCLKVRIWSRNAANAKRCAQEVGAKAVISLQDALRDADVVVTVTLATEPVVHGAWLKPGTVVICECTAMSYPLHDLCYIQLLVPVDLIGGNQMMM